VALSLPTLCLTFLAEAYFRTDLADADLSPFCSYEPTSQIIQEHHVRQLEKDDIVILHNVLSPQMLQGAREEVIKFRSIILRSGTGTVDKLPSITSSNQLFNKNEEDYDVRQDLVAWLRPQSNIGNVSSMPQDPSQLDSNINECLLHCVRLVRGVAHSLDLHGYTRSSSHRVPQQCQLALYVGDSDSGYSRHLDRCQESLFDLGLLEWLRLSDYRFRAVTVILYLNKSERQETEGGALKCWVRRVEKAQHTNDHSITREDDNGEFQCPFDIHPVGGTLVLFNSDRVEHKVMPSSTDRYALTVWINGHMEAR